MMPHRRSVQTIISNLQVASRKVDYSSDEEIGVKIPKDDDESEEER